MKLIRSLGMLVLLGSVSWMLGCTADENTSGPGTGVAPAGSGVAGGAVVPHSHDGEDVHAQDGDTPQIDAPSDDVPKTEEPKTEVPADDVPKTEEPKTEVPADDAPKTEEPKIDDAPKSE